MRGALPAGEPIVDSGSQIDVCATLLALRRGSSDCGGSGPSIQPDQEEAREMTKRALASLDLDPLVLSTVDGLLLAVPPGGPQ